MPLPIYRLRRWLMALAVLFAAVIAGMYFYARRRERNVLREIPNKIGIDIKQTASGFQFSKSDGGRTLFTIQASDLKQFKLNGSAELHNVSILLYGRDSSRFDQIYGDDFGYDKSSGNVTAKGEVQIDLEANPSGEKAPDQSTPKELKNPIHLNTHDLVFNQESGDAHTDARVDFSTPQASGWAVGVAYAAKSNTLTLNSQVHITFGERGERILAARGVISRDPRVIVLDHAEMQRPSGTVQAEQASFFLGPENNVERVSAAGNVVAQSSGSGDSPMKARADYGEMFLTGKQNLLQTATLSGKVHIERGGTQPMQGDAGRALLDFSGNNELKRVRAEDGVRLFEHAASTGDGTKKSSPQDFAISAPTIDFFFARGNLLDHARTSGAAQITITPAENSLQARDLQRSVITAEQFDAKFAPGSAGPVRLTSIHGAPNAKIVNSASGIPDRVSTSDDLEAAFLPEGGIRFIVQQGNLFYTDNQSAEKRVQAWAGKGIYTPGDEILTLTGNPRVVDGGMETTADTIRINRAVGDALAEKNVKSTYSELKEQPDGALLASSSPIHVAATRMTTRASGAKALYEGKARLWQDANIVTAPSIEFDRGRRSLLAQGTSTQPVSTVMVQAADRSVSSKAAVTGEQKKKKRAVAPVDDFVDITSLRLTYEDSERRAHYEGGVTAKGADFTATSRQADAYLVAHGQTPASQRVPAPSQLDHMVAEGNVVIQEPARKAQGERLVYTAADDKFVLTGGPPSIFDAERGKITGDSLTFFRSDDRVLVEGEASTPVVTQTRVAK